MKPTHPIRPTRSLCVLTCLCLVMLFALGAGCSAEKSDSMKQAPDEAVAPAPVVSVHLASLEPKPDYAPAEDPTRGTVYIASEVVVSNEHIKSAKAVEGNHGAVVDITLNDEGGENMEAFTKAHKGELVAIMVDDSLKSSATIMSVVTTRIQITGSFSMEEAEELANALNP